MQPTVGTEKHRTERADAPGAVGATARRLGKGVSERSGYHPDPAGNQAAHLRAQRQPEGSGGKEGQGQATPASDLDVLVIVRDGSPWVTDNLQGNRSRQISSHHIVPVAVPDQKPRRQAGVISVWLPELNSKLTGVQSFVTRPTRRGGTR
jgi:hypothetical protein